MSWTLIQGGAGRDGSLGVTPAELLNETIEAHGGRERWRRVGAIRAALSSGGLAFQSRCQPNALKNLKIEVRPHDIAVTLGDFVRRGWRGTWTPALAAIHDDRGQLVAQRRDPRSHFSGVVSQVYWDKLDILTFAGYALWNYLSFPFLLERDDVELVGATPAAGDGNLRLDVRFGPGIPTHSRRQSFHIDPGRRLVRHDYTRRADRFLGDRRQPVPQERGRRRRTLLYPAQGSSAPRPGDGGRSVSDTRLDRDRRP